MRVDVEDSDVVRQVVGDDHPAVIRQREEPWPPAPAGDPLARRDQPVRADSESRQRIVPAVGDVEVALVRAQAEMGGMAVAGEAWRESGDGLDLGQRSAGLRLERDERVAELVEQVHQAGSGQHVPRARSGSGPVRPDLRPDVPGGGVEGGKRGPRRPHVGGVDPGRLPRVPRLHSQSR